MSLVALIKPVVVGVDVPTPRAPLIYAVVPLNVNPLSPFNCPEVLLPVITLSSALLNIVAETPLEPLVPADPAPASSTTVITGPSDSPN